MSVVTPVETPDTDELRSFYETIERTSRGLGVLNVFKVMAHSPELMQSWWRMMTVLFTRLELEPRLRELAILRLFQIKKGAYGFAHHVRLGKEAGVTDEQIAQLSKHETSAAFTDLEQLVLQYTDACTELSDEAPELAEAVKAALGERQLVELTFCIANWNLMAHLLLPLDIEPEPAIVPYLPEGWGG
jgi:alkylhydroperoxidase family enzyme